MLMRTASAAALALWIPTVCMAAEDKAKMLTIGDNAPAIVISHWVKGEPVTAFEQGTVYVMEFWATWCAPCRVSMPHISHLQEQYADYDVTFIGVSDESLQTVVNFLTKADSENVTWHQKVHYTLATDPDRSTHDAYMRPAAQLGIPTAFIVGKDSRIEWIGNPMVIDDVLAKVVRGNWDRDEFKVAFEEKVAPVRRALRFMDTADIAAQRGDWDAAITAVTALVEDQPEQARMQTSLFRKMLRAAPARAYAYGNTLITENWDDAGILNGLAWITVDDAQVTTRDLDFALKAAEQACALTDHENSSILDTLARVYFEKGEIKAAIKWQRDALEKAGESPMVGELRETLIRYEKVAASRL